MCSSRHWQQLEHSLQLKKRSQAPTTVIITFIVTCQFLLIFKVSPNCTWDFRSQFKFEK